MKGRGGVVAGARRCPFFKATLFGAVYDSAASAVWYIHKMKLIPFSDFMRLKSIPRCQDLKCGIDVEEIEGRVRVLAICHRWKTPEHPDPKNEIIKRVLSIPNVQKDLAAIFFEKDFYVFYDYACVNQHPRTPGEEEQFKKDLLEMDKVFGDEHEKMMTKVFPLYAPDLRQRAWCLFETCLGHLHGNLVIVLNDVCKQFFDCFQIISAMTELADGINHPLMLIELEPKVFTTVDWILAAIHSSAATNAEDVSAMADLFKKHFMRYAAAKFAFQLHYVCVWNGRGELDVSLLEQEILRTWERRENFITPEVQGTMVTVRFRFQGEMKEIQSELVEVRDGRLCLEEFLGPEIMPAVEKVSGRPETSDRRFKSLKEKIRRGPSPPEATSDNARQERAGRATIIINTRKRRILGLDSKPTGKGKPPRKCSRKG